MISFSSLIGLTSFLTRSSYSSLWEFSYYRTMKDSTLSIFEINEKLLIPKKEIYKNIIYFFMGFLYSLSFISSLNYIYTTAIVNLIFYICILNMHLFIYKNKNQMLFQTLIIFLIIKIIYLFFNKYIIGLLFICSDLIVLEYPINKFRNGVLLNDKSYFNIERILIEIVINLLWIIYATSENLLCFFLICLINLFSRICMILGYQIVEGEIGINSRIYHCIINTFCIKNNFKGKKQESNIINS